MADFDDFRVLLSYVPGPMVAGNPPSGSWTATVTECPIKEFAGPKGSVEPKLTRDQLIKLRGADGWPNSTVLKEIGKAVWDSVMNPELDAAYRANLAFSKNNKRGMRLVIELEGDEPEPSTAGAVSVRELPLEALYASNLGFPATNPATPVSRSPKLLPDRDPLTVPLPLRVLVVVATPLDKPPAEMAKEKEAILESLKTLSAPGGQVELEFCEPPTREKLGELMQKRFHIVHFVCHGGFDVAGDDPSPRPHLALEQPAENGAPHGFSRPLDADTLETLLIPSGVRLVLMTACATASPTPAALPFHARAFDGVAQTLMRGTTDVSAVVAMQFDLENQAAVAFSKEFYTNLLNPELKLDEVVTRCRTSLVASCDVGHRSWVTPVVYWRAKEGRVFELAGLKRSLDPDVQKRLSEIETTARAVLAKMAEVANESPEFQQAAEPLLVKWRAEVEKLEHQRGELLGETLRLRGGSVKAGKTIACRLTLRLRGSARVGDITARIRYPTDKVTFGAAKKGASSGSAPLVNADNGEIELLIRDASAGSKWEPAAEDQELALLTFKVKPAVKDPFIELEMSGGQMERDGVEAVIEPLHGVLFIT